MPAEGESVVHGMHALDAQIVMALMTPVAQAAAKEASTRAVHDTFFLLGVDLDDPEHVRSTRDTFLHMIDRFEARKQRRETFRKGVVSGIITIVVTGLLTFLGVSAHNAIPPR